MPGEAAWPDEKWGQLLLKRSIVRGIVVKALVDVDPFAFAPVHAAAMLPVAPSVGDMRVI